MTRFFTPLRAGARTIVTAAMLLAAFGSTTRAQDQPPTYQPGWPCFAKIDPAYFKTAEATGGQVFLFHPSEVGESSVLMTAAMTHEETIFRAAGSLVEGVHEYQIPVDSTVESILFSVSLQCLQVVQVVRPSGDVLRSGDEGVEYHQFEAGRILTVSAPSPGLWRVTVAGRGLFFLVAQARSRLTLDSVTFVEPGGRPGHEGLFPMKGSPKQGTQPLLRVELSGKADQVAFRLMSSSGETIRSVELVADETEEESRTYVGPVRLDAAAFRVAATGVDRRGFRFQRMDGRLWTAGP
jgi:hypothetical protein